MEDAWNSVAWGKILLEFLRVFLCVVKPQCVGYRNTKKYYNTTYGQFVIFSATETIVKYNYK